jgi:hypothetical protein
VIYEGSFRMRLDDSGGVEHYYTYSYEHLDDLSFMKPPEAVFEDEPAGMLAILKAAVEERLRKAGWEGDGRLEILWLPPFADVGVEDNWGSYVWCAKQGNNGTSWLASKYPLKYKRLADQNENFPYETHLQAGIMFSVFRKLIEKLHEKRAMSKGRLVALSSVEEPMFAEISSELLTADQGALVYEFNDFLDGSFLTLLDEILGQGNSSNLKLSKLKANLEPKRYLTMDEQESIGTDTEGAQWLTMRGIIRDIGISYQFEPFLQKLSLLFKSCEFTPPEVALAIVKKHVQLRNCVQHHDRHVTTDALKLCGVENFDILEDDGSRTWLAAGSTVHFTLAELDRFVSAMKELANEFYKQTTKRIRRKVWIPRRQSQGSKPQSKASASAESQG